MLHRLGCQCRPFKQGVQGTRSTRAGGLIGSVILRFATAARTPPACQSSAQKALVLEQPAPRTRGVLRCNLHSFGARTPATMAVARTANMDVGDADG